MRFVFILSGLLLITGSWKLLKFSSTEKGVEFFKAGNAGFMGKNWVDGLSAVNGIIFSMLVFVTGVILLIIGIISDSV